MDANKIEHILLLHGSKLPPEGIQLIRERLILAKDDTLVQLIFSQLKDPTLALILSITIGFWGVDRFYIGDLSIGLGKFITCGGAWIWYIIDIFLIIDATKKKNMETIMFQFK